MVFSQVKPYFSKITLIALVAMFHNNVLFHYIMLKYYCLKQDKNVEEMDVLLKITVIPVDLLDKMIYFFKTGLATWIFNGGYTSLYFEVTETFDQT